MGRNIVPRENKDADLGTALKNWNRLYVDAITLKGSDLKSTVDGKVNSNILTNRGDIFAATGPGAVTRLPVGADGYVLTSNSLEPEGLEWTPKAAGQPLTENITVTVGSGGDFSTINQALDSVTSLYMPKYISGYGVHKVTIVLLSNFVMNEQVFVDSIDLSWITIIGEGVETNINPSAITRYSSTVDGMPVFLANNGGFLPIIGQLFNFGTTGGGGKHGIVVCNNSRAIILPNCGLKGAINSTIYALKSSIINANGAIATGSLYFNIMAVDNSTINANGAIATGSAGIGITAKEGSFINAQGADASGAGATGIKVMNGSIINANGSIGTLNPTPNTITSDGIIFKYVE